MNFPLSRRISDLQVSDIRLMTRECERVGGINLGQGLGDLPVPAPVRNGAFEAIAAKLLRDNGLEADPEREIIVTHGATGAFFAALTALLNPGDGILLPEPYYGYHLNTIRLCGLEPHFLTLREPAFELEEAALRAAVRPNTRAIVLCTPSNPSGKMLSDEEIRRVERVAAEHDLLVITDEIYEYITYDGRRHISPATVGSLRERTISIFGFSKTFSITGWRLGYAVAPEPLAAAINLVNDLAYVCAPTPLQYGVLEGLRASPEYFDQLRIIYQQKRDILCEGLAAAGIEPSIPSGAYYVLADIRRFGYPNAKAGALSLLEQTGVAAVPGSAFYRGGKGEHLIRFCFAKDDAVLREAVRRLRRFRHAD